MHALFRMRKRACILSSKINFCKSVQKRGAAYNYGVCVTPIEYAARNYNLTHIIKNQSIRVSSCYIIYKNIHKSLSDYFLWRTQETAKKYSQISF